MFRQVSSLSGPYQDRLSTKTSKHYFRDALCISRDKLELTPSHTQFLIFGHMPSWVHSLLRLRNKLVKLVGIEVGQDNMTPTTTELKVGDKAGFLTICEKYEDEIISYADDKHMTFYLSVAFSKNDIVVSSLVNQKTLIGRLYVNAILPFHYFIARTVINNARKANRI